jgi:hypothetical protein
MFYDQRESSLSLQDRAALFPVHTKMTYRA